MSDIVLAIAPIFLIIILGYGLRRSLVASVEFWTLIDKLVYWLLMPALFFVKIAEGNLGAQPIGRFAMVLYGGFAVAVLCGMALGRAVGQGQAVASSILQGSGRFNTFMALAIAQALYGSEGLQVAVLAAALLVPVVNLTIVTSLTVMLRETTGGLVRAVARDLARNPLILSIAAGLVENLAGLTPLPVINDTAALLGAAALPVMLLGVGANLKIRGMRAALTPILAATLGKMMIFPAVTTVAALVLAPGPLAARIALIFAALPTGVAAYTLARQMGGDAPLMAAIITIQTGVSFVTLPLTIAFGARLFS